MNSFVEPNGFGPPPPFSGFPAERKAFARSGFSGQKTGIPTWVARSASGNLDFTCGLPRSLSFEPQVAGSASSAAPTAPSSPPRRPSGPPAGIKCRSDQLEVGRAVGVLRARVRGVVFLLFFWGVGGTKTKTGMRFGGLNRIFLTHSHILLLSMVGHDHFIREASQKRSVDMHMMFLKGFNFKITPISCFAKRQPPVLSSYAARLRFGIWESTANNGGRASRAKTMAQISWRTLAQEIQLLPCPWSDVAHSTTTTPTPTLTAMPMQRNVRLLSLRDLKARLACGASQRASQH